MLHFGCYCKSAIQLSFKPMRFEFYHPALDNTPKLSVDGTVDNSVHFSHWQGNETPVELKADTSTEIALNLVGSSDRARFHPRNRTGNQQSFRYGWSAFSLDLAQW